MSQSQNRSFDNIWSKGKKPANNSIPVLNVIDQQELTFKTYKLFLAYLKVNAWQIYNSINIKQNHVFCVYDKQEEFEEKEKVYTEANKKLQVDITKLEGKNSHLIAENTRLVAEVAKLKGLCYLNESEQGIGVSGVDGINTNDSAGNV